MIKLNVLEQKADKDNPATEFISHGEFSADLTAETVETESREFADFLIENGWCEEIVEVELAAETLNKMTVPVLTEKAVELKIENPEKVKAALIAQILTVLAKQAGGAE